MLYVVNEPKSQKSNWKFARINPKSCRIKVSGVKPPQNNLLLMREDLRAAATATTNAAAPPL